uniref:Uncharacterized protein n=1 Tax=Timema douglasi TaxID=61478 RepID=A0A7R8VQR5_TIMDO|nr:unnamed protein product [Timema douglasi]
MGQREKCHAHHATPPQSISYAFSLGARTMYAGRDVVDETSHTETEKRGSFGMAPETENEGLQFRQQSGLVSWRRHAACGQKLDIPNKLYHVFDEWIDLDAVELNTTSALANYATEAGPLLNRRSALSTRNGLTLYKQLLKPILNYACPAWGQLADTYMKRMQAFQSVSLRIIVGAPWYVRNETLHCDLDMPTIKYHFRELVQSFYDRLPCAILSRGLGTTSSTLVDAIDVPKPCLDKRDVSTVVCEALTQPAIE